MGYRRPVKKKNKLYRDFIKYKSSNHEIKYKRYKNKLITIMRQAKKDYYKNKLYEYKTNIKETGKF